MAVHGLARSVGLSSVEIVLTMYDKNVFVFLESLSRDFYIIFTMCAISVLGNDRKYLCFPSVLHGKGYHI